MAVPFVDQNPYVGPRPFQRGQPLFGRDREVQELRYLLTSERIVLLYAPSGAGKSSLVNAGLIGNLESRFDIWGPTRVSATPPAGAANRYVWSAISLLEDNPNIDAGIGWRDYLESHSPEKRPLIIFDQFEEILRVDPVDQNGERRAFFEQTGNLLADPGVWALFVLREDYLAPLDPYARLIPSHFRNRYRLDRLTHAGAKDAIEKPTEQTRRKYAPGVVDALVNNLAKTKVLPAEGPPREEIGEYVEPLQLQVVCFDLWERMREDDLSIDPEDVGDVSEALSNYYATCVAAVATRENAGELEIRKWFNEVLITPDGVRNQVRRTQDRVGGLEYRFAKALEDTYLVRKEPRGGGDWYELSHDRLIGPVRDNNNRWFDKHLQKVQKVAALWCAEDEGHRSRGLLFEGDELREAQQWARRNVLTDDVKVFLAASEQAQTARNAADRERQLRDTRAWLIVVCIAFLGAAILGYVAWQQSEQKQVALDQKQDALDQATDALKQAKEANDDANKALLALAAGVGKDQNLTDLAKDIQGQEVKTDPTPAERPEICRTYGGYTAAKWRTDFLHETRPGLWHVFVASAGPVEANADKLVQKFRNDFPQLDFDKMDTVSASGGNHQYAVVVASGQPAATARMISNYANECGVAAGAFPARQPAE